MPVMLLFQVGLPYPWVWDPWIWTYHNSELEGLREPPRHNWKCLPIVSGRCSDEWVGYAQPPHISNDSQKLLRDTSSLTKNRKCLSETSWRPSERHRGLIASLSSVHLPSTTRRHFGSWTEILWQPLLSPASDINIHGFGTHERGSLGTDPHWYKGLTYIVNA